MNDKYILIGQTAVPCPDVFEWGRWLGPNREARRVAATRFGEFCWVSTVFLGLDHNWGNLLNDAGSPFFREVQPGKPLLYETMVCWGGDDWYEQERCSTWLEAEQMHQAMLREICRFPAIWGAVRRRWAGNVRQALDDWRVLWRELKWRIR